MIIDDYRLIDQASGRKLEAFGNIILDRPAPAADSRDRVSAVWNSADAKFTRQIANEEFKQEFWSPPLPPWQIRFQGLSLQLKQTPFGHVGLFPEHAIHWPWFEQIDNLADKQILHLFAYTGTTSLKLAQRGAHVVHLDSSKSVVNWARKNAQLSQLDHKPIRWIVEDALKFVNREIKRGNKYDGFVADPPSYGHGPNREVWKIEQNIGELLDGLRELLPARPTLALLTCHSQDYDHNALWRLLADHFPECRPAIEHGEMSLKSETNKTLNCGWFARFADDN